jgi:hypothetical protein
MIHRTILLVSLLLIVLTFSIGVTAQPMGPFTCPEVVEQALATADMACTATGRNQVCYGNSLLTATSRANVSTFQFDEIGDIEGVAAVETLRLNGMDEQNRTWGVALMRLQANLPNTLPGQNVTFVLFGDVQITSAVTDEQMEQGDYTPMQAFYMSTGIGMSRCEEAPQDGVLVQTPEGVGEVSFVVNEVEIAIGSTAFLQAEPQGDMIITMLEGAAAVRINKTVFPIVEGMQLRFGVDAQLRPLVDRQPVLESYERGDLLNLPLNLLERSINIREGFSESELALVQSRISLNEPLCGEEPFLPCSRLPVAVGGELCVLADRREGLLDRANTIDRPICETVAHSSDDMGILSTPTPLTLPIEPTVTPILRIEPTAPPGPRIIPTVTLTLRIVPTATLIPRIEPSATPVPRLEPSATSTPRTEPTATPMPRSDSTDSQSSLLDPLGLLSSLVGPAPTATSTPTP